MKFNKFLFEINPAMLLLGLNYYSEWSDGVDQFENEVVTTFHTFEIYFLLFKLEFEFIEI